MARQETAIRELQAPAVGAAMFHFYKREDDQKKSPANPPAILSFFFLPLSYHNADKLLTLSESV